MSDPYAPPATPVDALPEPAGEAEALRRACIDREAGVRSVGALALVGAVAALGAGWWVAGQPGLPGALPPALGGLALLLAAIGVGLLGLRPWARLLGSALVLLGALAMAAFLVPWGDPARATVAVASWLPLGIALRLLWSGPALTVFSPRYRREVVPATPQVRYRAPLWLWAAGSLTVLGAVALAVLAVARA